MPKVTGEVAELIHQPDHIAVPDALTLQAQDFAQGIVLDPTPLEDTLSDAYTDAYLVGGKDAITQLADHGHAISDTDPMKVATDEIDWGEWTPGHPIAADKLTGTGLQDMLDEVGVRIQGIDDTTRDDIARILEQGIREGIGARDMAARIDKVRHNPARSMLIARTEINRSFTQASLDTFTRDGVAEFDLLTEAGACAICEGIKAANPHPMSDVAAIPPEHPNCRCSVSPVV